MARAADPWLQGSLLEQQALEARATAAGTLPDPVLAVGFANLPIDSFEFDQEPMTQFKVGVSQNFARGDTLSLQQQQLEQLGAAHPHRRADRRARVGVQVAALWLDAYRARQTHRLIEQDRALFEYLVDVAQSKYASALAATRQQDVIRAQLELTRLEDRLAGLQQSYGRSTGLLGQWLGADFDSAPSPDWQAAVRDPGPTLSDPIPVVPLQRAEVLLRPGALSPDWLAAQLLRHPAIAGLDEQINARDSGVALAKEKYKPQWGVNASYGYREDDPLGDPRDDFFSVGVTFDLPLFTGNRQDKELESATARAAALRTEKWLALRKMRAELDADRATLLRLRERRDLYQGQLLAQMREQAEASLNAYTSDDGDFAEVVRARIAELNARIEALAIDLEIVRAHTRLNYYFTGSATAAEEQS